MVWNSLKSRNPFFVGVIELSFFILGVNRRIKIADRDLWVPGPTLTIGSMIVKSLLLSEKDHERLGDVTQKYLTGLFEKDDT